MNVIYDQALKICETYLSTSAKNFLDRQIKMHLGKSPDQITQSDKESLAKWCKTSSGMLIGGDKAIKLSDQILAL